MMDLSAIPIYDHHAHPPRHWQAGLTASDLRAALALGSATADHMTSTVLYRRLCRDLAAFYECEASEEAVLAARAQRTPTEILNRSLIAASLETALIDDGYELSDMVPLAELRSFGHCRIGRILRIEALAEQLMQIHGDNFDAFDAAFHDALTNLRAQGIAALKSVAAYRCGLRLASDVRRHFAATAYTDERLVAARSEHWRISNLILISYLVGTALDEAANQQVPFQFLTGTADKDIDLRTASPLHVRDLFIQERWRNVSFVLLHCYPSVRDVAYLARVHPNVYVDLSLPTLMAAHGASRAWAAVLELAPASKLLFGSNAFVLPELFFLGAHYGREALGRALDSLIGDNWLTLHEAEHMAEQILNSNARALYGRW